MPIQKTKKIAALKYYPQNGKLTGLFIAVGYISSTLCRTISGTVSRECSIVYKLTPGLSCMMASTMYKEMSDTSSKYTALLFLYLMKFGTVAQTLKKNTVTIHRV